MVRRRREITVVRRNLIGKPFEIVGIVTKLPQYPQPFKTPKGFVTHSQVPYPLSHELPLNYTLKDRKSIKTLRIEYGQLGLKFVLRMFEGQIERRGERENLPKEILFDDEQELLK